MGEKQDIARAFGPFIAIEEYENIRAINRRQRPALFLRRNLSYSAVYQEHVERNDSANTTLSLQLEVINSPPKYVNAITIVAAVCAVVIGPDGEEAMIPLAAKIGRVAVPPPSEAGKPPRKHSCVLSMKVPMPDGVLSSDVVVLVLHKKDSFLSRLLRHIVRAQHRNPSSNSGGKQVTCNIRHNTVFQWFHSNSNVLYTVVQPSPEMYRADGIGATKKGLMELQPGILTTYEAHVQHSEDGTRVVDEIPACFSIRAGNVDDETPMLRYALTLEAVQPVIRKKISTTTTPTTTTTTNKRKRGSGNLNGLLLSASSPPAASPQGEGGISRRDSSSLTPAMVSFPPPQHSLITVYFCSQDGAFTATSKITHQNGFLCPFESCGLRCRGSISALQQHLVSSHSYYEYFCTTSNQGPAIWIRCKKEWFRSDGSFLPRLTSSTLSTTDAMKLHPLAPLLSKTPIYFQFMYHCPPNRRSRRYSDGSRCPEDGREVKMEAAASAECPRWAWTTAPLVPAAAGKPTKVKNKLIQPQDKLLQPGKKGPRGGSADGGGGNARSKLTRQQAAELAEASAAAQVHPHSPSKLPSTTVAGLPKFYHSRTCVAMTAADLANGTDSDEESDTEQCKMYSSTALEERGTLCPEERDFMLCWNMYIHKHPLLADFGIPAACCAFAKAHAARLADARGSFRRCYAAHLTNLWKFRLITPPQMHAALLAASSR